VSACLLGLCTRYDGRHCLREEVAGLARDGLLVPVCPEQLGGLATPRAPAEIAWGDGRDVLQDAARVLNAEGEDVTENYLRGARVTAEIVAIVGARRALLKEGSPSCGACRIKRDGRDVDGSGVTAALLLQRGIQVDGIE